MIAIFGEGKRGGGGEQNSGVIGKVAVSIRVIHMYLIEGLLMGNMDFLYNGKSWIDSREGVRIRSRSWRVQSPPLENCDTILTL